MRIYQGKKCNRNDIKEIHEGFLNNVKESIMSKKNCHMVIKYPLQL